MEQRISFNSAGDTVRGVLLTPDDQNGPFPLLIMAGGWCYTKDVVMPHYAQSFLDIGVACLIFDYRRFGESDGEPRQHVNPWDQVEDYRNALCFAETLDDVDLERTGIWGISYSGGHVIIVAALDRRARFAISTIPVVDGLSTMRRVHGERRFAALLQHIAEDRQRRFDGESSAMLPMSTTDPDHELSTWPFPKSPPVFEAIKAREAPLHIHANTVESVELLLAYQVKPYATRINETPVMMAVAQGDNITSADLEIEVFNAIPCPNKQLAVVEGVDHLSLYSNAEHLARVSDMQAVWLEAWLQGRTPQRVAAAV